MIYKNLRKLLRDTITIPRLIFITFLTLFVPFKEARDLFFPKHNISVENSPKTLQKSMTFVIHALLFMMASEFVSFSEEIGLNKDYDYPVLNLIYQFFVLSIWLIYSCSLAIFCSFLTNIISHDYIPPYSVASVPLNLFGCFVLIFACLEPILIGQFLLESVIERNSTLSHLIKAIFLLPFLIFLFYFFRKFFLDFIYSLEIGFLKGIAVLFLGFTVNSFFWYFVILGIEYIISRSIF